MQAGSLPISGILINEKKIGGFYSHVDLPSVQHLTDMSPKDMTDFGLLDLWAYKEKETQPYMVANINPSNITYVKGWNYKFKLPTKTECSTRIVEVNAPDMSKVGFAGTPFTITVKGEHLGSYGAQVMFDIYTPFVMTVKEVVPKGTDHWVYTMVYQSNLEGQDYIPAHLLQKGSQLYKIAGGRSLEFGQDYDSWSVGPTNSYREYIGLLSKFQLQTHYHMTDEACEFFDGATVDRQLLNESLNSVVEYVGISGELKNGVKTVKDYLASGGSKDKMGFHYMAMKYDDISLGILAKQNMNMVLWHPGSRFGLDGQDQSFVAPGIWHQMDNSGYKHTYNIEDFSAEMILTALSDFNSGKVMSTPLGKERVYRIRTGRGGRNLLNQVFKEYANSVNGIIDAKEYKQLIGDNEQGLIVNMPWYQGIRIPGEAVLLIDEDPTLEADMYTNDFTNPKINGFRLSSYSMIIQDYDTSNNNIKILRNESLANRRVRMEVVAGDRTHPMFEESYKGAVLHQGANLQTGFGAYFRAYADTGFVVDPTKLLKFVPVNPLTGLATL